MKVVRKELLQRLLMVSPGISKMETIQQSSCVVLKKGRFYTLSQEIACSVPSGLDKEATGALRAEKLLDLLKVMPDDEIDVTVSKKSLSVKGKKRKASINMEQEILLPVDEVDLPDSWQPLHQDFPEAVDLVRKCTKRNKEFLKECIHIHPDYMEASDDARIMRYSVPACVEKSVLVRAHSIQAMIQLGMTKAAETFSWLHFRNPTGLRMSVRKFLMEDYPDHSKFLEMRGRQILFPKGLQAAATSAGLFEEEDHGISVSVRKGIITVESTCQEGSYSEDCTCKYTGPDLSFRVPPKLISELVADYSECEVTEAALRVSSPKFIYLTGLEMS